MNRRSLAPLMLLSLVGCTGGGGRTYPSLAMRPVERGSFDEPARPVATATPDAALDADVARQGGELDRLRAGFDALVPAAERSTTAATRAAVGSDAWLDAQAALAGLDDARSRVSALTAALNDQAAARAATLLAPYASLDALAARAAAEGERESGVIAGLQGRVPAA